MKSIASAFATTILSVAVLAGCDNSADRAAKEAAEAQAKADKTAQDSLREAREKTAQAYDQANTKIANAQAKADDKVNEARKTFAEVRTEAQKDFSEKLGKADKRIVDLRTRLETSKSLKQPRTDLDKDMKELQAQSTSLRTQVNDVPMALETTWEGTRKDIQTRLDKLTTSIDALERKIDGKV